MSRDRTEELIYSTHNIEDKECNNKSTKETMANEDFIVAKKCRVCLGLGNIPIFGDNVSPDITDDIEVFGNILIRYDDNLPKHICDCCKKLLQAAVLFRQTAEQSDMYLKSQKDNSDRDFPLDSVKGEVEFDIEDSKATETEKPELIIKEEIIVEPPCLLEIIHTNDTFSSEKININENLHMFEDKTVSLPASNNYTCKTCDIHFQTSKEYSQHKKSIEHKKVRQSNKIECEMCSKKVSRAYYSRHVEAHSNEGKDEKLQCPICNKSYSKTYFNYHVTHSHSKDDKKTQSERIQCNICDKSYEKQYYKFHLAIHDNDSSKYVCDTCGKSFIQQSAFKRHRLIHGNELAFKCTLCPYRGRHPGLVKTHMQTHTRDYQHRCMECPARFLTKSNLNKHLQRHKGPVDFKCEACKRGFYSKLELERHFEADHLGVKNHVCNICGKAFGYRNAMMSHQLKVHKREKLTNGKGRLPLYLEADRKDDGNK